MDTLLGEFRSQISELSDMLTLQLLPPSTPDADPAVTSLSSHLGSLVDRLSLRVEELRLSLSEEYESLRNAEEMKLKLDVQAAHLSHLLSNTPESLPVPQPAEPVKPTKKGTKKGENADPNTRKSGFSSFAKGAKEVDRKKEVAPLSEQEFEGLPRYLLGRLTREKYVLLPSYRLQ
jgi:hypothetical protein